MTAKKKPAVLVPASKKGILSRLDEYAELSKKASFTMRERATKETFDIVHVSKDDEDTYTVVCYDGEYADTLEYKREELEKDYQIVNTMDILTDNPGDIEKIKEYAKSIGATVA